MKESDMFRDAVRKLKLTIPPGCAFMVTSSPDIKYLSGFYSTGEILLIPRRGPVLCFIDPMNHSLAEKELTGTGIRVVSGRSPAMSLMAGYVRKMGLRTLFFDAAGISVRTYRKMSSFFKGVKLSSRLGKLDTREHLDMVRTVKSPDEIFVLRSAARKTAAIWRHVKNLIAPGMTEIQIAGMVDAAVRDAGFENSFPTIAAAGPNSAYPHAIPGKKKLGRKEHLVVDFGLRHGLYCSDLTRIWGECRIDGQIKALCDSVREVQKKAIDLIEPGASIGRVAGKIDEIFQRKGLKGFVIHGLGHGIGIEVHEKPFFGTGSREVFSKGMVLTVEPGLYVPGKGGARIEDMVLVTPKGREVLTK